MVLQSRLPTIATQQMLQSDYPCKVHDLTIFCLSVQRVQNRLDLFGSFCIKTKRTRTSAMKQPHAPVTS